MKYYHILCGVALAALAGGMSACSDEWDDHYKPSDSGASTATVMEMVKADASLSQFAKMIEIAGYADLLSSSQTFTVFAPTNDALASVDITDEALVRRIVLNHIARFNVSTATPGNQGVKMYNGKRFFFNGLTFGSAPIVSADNRAANGIVHVVSSQIPYAYNLREYIDTHSNTTEIAAFIARFDEQKLDLEASRPLSVNEQGQTVYDSVMVAYNRIFEHDPLGLGAIASEDSLFTMIIPTDDAWRQAYQRIAPYFNVYDADPAVADSIRDVQTSMAILSDLVYREQIADPAAYEIIESTSGSEITNPAALFAGTTLINASNGLIYEAPTLNYDNTLTWNKPIEVEGETTTGRTTGSATTVNVRTVDSSNALAEDISEMRYLEVTPTSPSRQPGVTFSIPDVLSGEYDIYVSIVPANVLDATVVNDSTRLQFTLSYRNEKGATASQSFKDNSFTTHPTEMTLIKVATAFQFPVSNYYDRLWSMDETHSDLDKSISTSLYVTTNVTNNEFNRSVFTRNFRLDRIILLPAKK